MVLFEKQNTTPWSLRSYVLYDALFSAYALNKNTSSRQQYGATTEATRSLRDAPCTNLVRPPDGQLYAAAQKTAKCARGGENSLGNPRRMLQCAPLPALPQLYDQACELPYGAVEVENGQEIPFVRRQCSPRKAFSVQRMVKKCTMHALHRGQRAQCTPRPISFALQNHKQHACAAADPTHAFWQRRSEG